MAATMLTLVCTTAAAQERQQETEEVEVELTEASYGEKADEDGFVSWTVRLPGFGHEELELKKIAAEGMKSQDPVVKNLASAANHVLKGLELLD